MLMFLLGFLCGVLTATGAVWTALHAAAIARPRDAFWDVEELSHTDKSGR
jgi:hypothetical protein